ncbi:MAG: diguanylate cyclase domain-containing protein [Myxococcota bacterium]
MKAPADAPSEAKRLETLRSLGILDTLPEERFDRVTRLAKRLFGVEIALVSLVDANRQWFKSRQGLDAAETPREISFCGHTILRDEVLVVNDAREDERFHDNPLVSGDPNIRFYAGYPLQAPNGEKLGTLCLIDPEPRGLDGDDLELLTDLAGMVEGEFAALEAATIDSLTGLTNRLGFEAIATHALAASKRHDRPLTLLFIDLDRFKEINDRLGHAAGDRALCAVAGILRETFRESDLVARMGGDEFCVLLTLSGAADAKRPLDGLEQAVAAWNETGGADFELAYSVGVVEFDPARHRDLPDLLADADQRMYAHKQTGR